MWVILTLVVAAFALLWVLWLRKKNELLLGISNYAPFQPFVGSMPFIFTKRNRVFEWFAEMRQGGDKYMIIGVNHYRVLFCFNPKDVKHFLEKNFKNYERHTNNRWWVKLFGKGIFMANGVQWKKQRRAAHPLFTNKSIASIQPIFATRAEEVLSIFRSAKEPLDIQDIYFRYTLDSIGEIFCGNNIGSLKSPVPFSEAFNRAQYLSETRFNNIFTRFRADPEFDGLLKIMADFIYDIIDKRREQGSDYASSGTDLLSKFMQMTDPETDKPFTREILKDIMINFFIAGRDTTAILLSWTTYLLIQHPEEKEKLVQEIKEVVGDRHPTPEDLPKLKLMSNVLSETLRLYPPVPSDGRRSINEDVLPSDGTRIPPKTLLLYSSYVIHRDPELWDNPESFIPSRWEDPNVLKHPYQYLPFHAGAQTCLGRYFALTEAKTLLVMILREFDFTLVEGQVIEPLKAIVMPIKNGLKVLVRKRES
eukprot:TRINITY_DN11661_c0_g1_i1.p1 TRINITY_DN11661_c0_g1~~TRINITY_DN11661_c0_g1_i1.p1  ORF type:complete len:478 (+),score=65.93 TRINITY_DN11661_c0_g1_i1:56-1489(+)